MKKSSNGITVRKRLRIFITAGFTFW